MDFATAYKQLNAAQKQAVDQIDGPLLVLAGPGTGKTQLLSARVAYILKETDTLAQNILCLTFTESGARNMRERLSSFIGQDAYSVNISTYHAFGGDLLRRFPEYFTELRLQNPVDELGRFEILSAIVEAMSYQNPLKQTRHHIGDLINTVSEVKRALLTSDVLAQLANENLSFLASANADIAHALTNFVRMPRKQSEAASVFEEVLAAIERNAPTQAASEKYGTTAALAATELREALDLASSENSTKPLTAWKDAWLVKNASNTFVLEGELQTKRLAALADVLTKYSKELNKRGLYDFDDMILRSIEALENNDELRFTLQEQYQYLLLDEFQDTNAAQFKLVSLLTDNPVHEGRPNVMAVGDDDQAIYAFQGAHYSNMLQFANMYSQTTVVNLTENYRSHEDILSAAEKVAGQISERLHHNIDGMSKSLSASGNQRGGLLARHEAVSDVSERTWIAAQVSKLVESGTSPSEIAIVAPRHKYLEPLVPHLLERGIPVRYEKREDILQAPVTKQLVTLCELVLALSRSDTATADALWPQVLSYAFWQLPVREIWKLSWKVSDARGKTNWTSELLESEPFKDTALLLVAIATGQATKTAEEVLDQLIGSSEVTTNEPGKATLISPLKRFFSESAKLQTTPALFYETLTHLTVIRSKLREHQATQEHTLTVEDFISFVNLYEQSGQQMTNTSPYNQQSEAVQLMTTFKAKGLEFEHVFLPSVHDDVWGETSRGNSNKLTLPKNLSPIRHAGANEDERLRIFFVALTRAKSGLYLSSHAQNYAGKQPRRLKYLDERPGDDNTFTSAVLPTSTVYSTDTKDSEPLAGTLLEDWRSVHTNELLVTSMRDLLSSRLDSYQLSPTHLNTFTDMEYGGPEAFFFNTLLRFPSAPGVDGQFGNAIHETLEWLQHEVDRSEQLPKLTTTTQYFNSALLSKHLAPRDYAVQKERGEHALKCFMNSRGDIFKKGDKAEANFRSEGVFIGEAHLAGKIDRMEIDTKNKQVTVVDYKTGRPYERWESTLKLHKYKTQLYCYKILIENSRTYKDYTVTTGRLEFIEPDVNGKSHQLTLEFDEQELERTKKLLVAMWARVRALDWPDVGEYSQNLQGTKAFEKMLLT